jgi:hypothetical protein
MRAPGWFWGMMAVWVCLGIPSFALGQGFRGTFSLLPDPPPILWAENLVDQTLGTLAWASAVFIVYLPLFAVPALLVWRRRRSRINNAPD